MANSFELRRLSQKDVEPALEFLREYFFPFEPCAKNLDLCPHGYRIPALEKLIENIILEEFSVGAFNKMNNELIGVLILHEMEDGKEESEIVDVQSNCQKFPEKFQKLEKFFIDLCTNFGKGNVFSTYNVERVMDIYIVCTNKSCARQGVGKALMDESIKIAKSNGFQAIQCMALSFYTQKICQKQGYKVLFSVPYKDYTQDGKKLFDASTMGEHQEVSKESGVTFVLPDGVKLPERFEYVESGKNSGMSNKSKILIGMAIILVTITVSISVSICIYLTYLSFTKKN